jgi:hypothetical protein
VSQSITLAAINLVPLYGHRGPKSLWRKNLNKRGKTNWKMCFQKVLTDITEAENKRSRQKPARLIRLFTIWKPVIFSTQFLWLKERNLFWVAASNQ